MSLLEPFVLYKGYMTSGMPFVLCRTRKEVTYRMYTLDDANKVVHRIVEHKDFTRNELDKLIPFDEFKDHRQSRHLVFMPLY